MDVERVSFVEESETKIAFLRQHIYLVKTVGVVFIILSVCIIPSVVLISTVCSRHDNDIGASTTQIDVDDIAVTTTPIDANQTACLYVKQFTLARNMRVTVCNQHSEIIVDIRRFINGTSTIIGIPLHLHQWLTLKQLTPLIDRAIAEARTFWKNVNSY